MIGHLNCRRSTTWRVVYRATGQPKRAMELYEQALPARGARWETERRDEARSARLNNMAGVYGATGQPQRAMELYEQALPLKREVGDRAGEAATLNNMAGVYDATGQPKRAMELYEQALPLMREVGDRAGEAATLNNMAGCTMRRGSHSERWSCTSKLYPSGARWETERERRPRSTTWRGCTMRRGSRSERLELYEQALPLMREVGDRAGEAATLNNMAEVYRATGQPSERWSCTSRLYPSGARWETGRERQPRSTTWLWCTMRRGSHSERWSCTSRLYPSGARWETGRERRPPSTTWPMVYRATGQPQRAMELYEQALPLMREVGDRAGEATTLGNIAVLLYQGLNRRKDAIDAMQQAIAVLDETGLPQTSGGNTREELQHYLDEMRQGNAPGQSNQPATMPSEQLQVIVHNTVAVMTTMQERRADWHKTITDVLQDAQQQGADWQIEVDFYTAVLALLEGQSSSLPDDHPYAAALAQIQAGIAAGGIQDDDTGSEGNEKKHTKEQVAMPQIFVSHARQDAACAEQIRQGLEVVGYTSWREPDSLSIESILYPRTIENIILSSAALVLVWSDGAAQSDWVERHLLFAQQVQKPIVPVLLDGTALPNTLVGVTPIDGHVSCVDVVAQLLPLLPPSTSEDALLKLAEQAAHSYVRERKEAIDAGVAMLQRGEQREAVLAILEYLAHNDLMDGVREKAREALGQYTRQAAAAPAPSRATDSRHTFGVRCKNGHVSYFDRREVCSAHTTFPRETRQSAGQELDELLLKCETCGVEVAARVDCGKYRKH